MGTIEERFDVLREALHRERLLEEGVGPRLLGVRHVLGEVALADHEDRYVHEVRLAANSTLLFAEMPAGAVNATQTGDWRFAGRSGDATPSSSFMTLPLIFSYLRRLASMPSMLRTSNAFVTA